MEDPTHTRGLPSTWSSLISFLVPNGLEADTMNNPLKAFISRDHPPPPRARAHTDTRARIQPPPTALSLSFSSYDSPNKTGMPRKMSCLCGVWKLNSSRRRCAPTGRRRHQNTAPKHTRSQTSPPAETVFHSSPIHSTAGKVTRSRYATEGTAGGMANRAGPEGGCLDVQIRRGGRRWIRECRRRSACQRSILQTAWSSSCFLPSVCPLFLLRGLSCTPSSPCLSLSLSLYPWAPVAHPPRRTRQLDLNDNETFTRGVCVRVCACGCSERHLQK